MDALLDESFRRKIEKVLRLNIKVDLRLRLGPAVVSPATLKSLALPLPLLPLSFGGGKKGLVGDVDDDPGEAAGGDKVCMAASAISTDDLELGANEGDGSRGPFVLSACS